MKISIFRIIMLLLYVVSFLIAGGMIYQGLDYYELPLGERPHHEQHELLKPGGLWGHGFGVVGSSLIILLFFYSLRKREVFGLRFGRLSRWLDIHIWMGIVGPLFVTIHTAGKFGGLVSISFFSMLVVALSGFLGRYIYMLIPRDEEGMALPLDEIDTKIEGLGALLHSEYHVPDSVNRLIEAHSGAVAGIRLRGWRAILSLLVVDLMRPIRSYRLSRHIRLAFPDCPKEAASEIVRLAKRKSTLNRRRAVLGSLNSIFHYWHVFHKPFAVVMIIIMLIHITIVVLMGYKWVF